MYVYGDVIADFLFKMACDVIMIVGLGGNTHRCDITTMDVYILYNASLGTVQLQFVI